MLSLRFPARTLACLVLVAVALLAPATATADRAGGSSRAAPQGLPLARHRPACPAAAQIERHQQVELVVRVAGKGERGEATDGYVDAKLLPQLTDQSGLGRFAGIKLAAGELPQPGHATPLGPAREQDAAVGVDQRTGGDEYEWFAGRGRPRLVFV